MFLLLRDTFVLSVQVMLMFPIVVNEIAGTPSAVKWMYAIEALLSFNTAFTLLPVGVKNIFACEQR